MTRNPFSVLIPVAWQYAGPDRLKIVLYLFAFSIAQALSLLEPFLVGRMINTVQLGEITFPTVLFYLSCYLGMYIGFSIIHYPCRWIERVTAFHIRSRCKNDLFQMLTGLPLKWHRESVSGDIVDKVNRATDGIFNFTASSYQNIYSLVRFFGVIAALFWYDSAIGLLVVSASAFVVFTIIKIDQCIFHQVSELNAFENKVNSAIFDYISNIVTVITLRLQKRVRETVAQKIFASLSTFRKNAAVEEAKWCFALMMVNSIIVSVLALHAYKELALTGTLLAGNLYTLYGYLNRIGSTFYEVAWQYGNLTRHAASVEGILPLKNAYERLPHYEELPLLHPDWKKIELRNIYFRYEDDISRDWQVKNVSLSLHRGQRIAFIGESGSGKSTMLRLLRGLDQANEGEVFIDGEKSSAGLQALASRTTLIPQDPELFADTVQSNVTFGIHADLEHTLDALDKAQFLAVLERLPQGLQTNIAEKGINLSGGEKQRLAVGRGLFFAQESDIILLDEPTSSVDVKNERMIYERLLTANQGNVVISSLHKLHLLDLFDEVYVFRHGAVIESGSFSSLMAKGGILTSLLNEYQKEVENG